MFSAPECPFELRVSHMALSDALGMYALWDASRYTQKDQAASKARTQRAHSADCLVRGGPGQQLELSFNHGSMTSACLLTVYTPEESEIPEVVLDREEVVMHLIMKACVIANVFREMHSLGVESVLVSASSHPPQLVLIGAGTGAKVLGTAKFTLPNSPEIFSRFSVEAGACAQTYAGQALFSLCESLQLASLVNVRIDTRGVLNLQGLYEFGQHNCIFDFLCLSRERD